MRALFLCSSSGFVKVFGEGADGQLGIGGEERVDVFGVGERPQLLTGPIMGQVRFARVAAAGNASMAISTEGHIYCWCVISLLFPYIIYR